MAFPGINYSIAAFILSICFAYCTKPSVESDEPISAIDLCAQETANCYIVYNAGWYKFKAVKGNSSQPLSPSSAEVLWESFNTTEVPSVGSIVSDVRYDSDGYVSFRASGKAGNALLAVRDAGGNILWSWHIWIPATKIHSAKYSTMSEGGLMDRNLGALSTGENNPLSCGLIYQWGRKDPFPGPAEQSPNNPEAVTNGTEENGGKFRRVSYDGTMDLQYSISHPAEFIYSDSADADWTDLKDNSLWGRTSKSVYDPCPPGYRVMDSGVFKDVPYEIKGTGLIIDGIHWYPFNGVRWNTDGKLHASTNTASAWTAYGYLKSRQAEYFHYYNNNFRPAASAPRSYGSAVRCFTDETPAPVKNDKKFFKALPAGTSVTGVKKDGRIYKVSYSNGSVSSLDTDKGGFVTVSEDGYWEVNGAKSPYRHVGVDYMHVGNDGYWYRNSSKTSERAFAVDSTAAQNGIVLTGMVSEARSISFLFSDGSSLALDKKQDFGMFAKKTRKDELAIYMGLNGSEKWIRYRFYYRNSNGYHEGTYPDNYDNWGIGTPMTATKTGDASFTDNTGEVLFLDGESEAAVQTNDSRTGEKTYSGGVLHGYELMCAEAGKRRISFKIDGVEVAEDALFDIRSAKRIEIEQHTRIARAYTENVLGEAFADVTKIWVFEDGKVNITVRYDMLQNVDFYLAKFGMFCVKRRLDGRGQGIYVTNLARKDSAPYTFYDLSDGWESRISLNTKDTSVSRVEEYGDLGVSFALVFDRDKPNTLKSGGGFDMRTNGNNYNKIYFDICGNYSAKSGESLYSTVHWEIDYISDYKK